MLCLESQSLCNLRREQDTAAVVGKNFPSHGLLDICRARIRKSFRLDADIRDQCRLDTTYVMEACAGGGDSAAEFSICRRVGKLLEQPRNLDFRCYRWFVRVPPDADKHGFDGRKRRCVKRCQQVLTVPEIEIPEALDRWQPQPKSSAGKHFDEILANKSTKSIADRGHTGPKFLGKVRDIDPLPRAIVLSKKCRFQREVDEFMDVSVRGHADVSLMQTRHVYSHEGMPILRVATWCFLHRSFRERVRSTL